MEVIQTIIYEIIWMFSQNLLTICVTVISTMGIALIFKTSNTTNFAQGSIAALGCYLIYYLVKGWKIDFPSWAAIIIGVIGGVVVGLLIDIGIFRRGRNVNPIGKQIITMGMVTLIVGAIPLIFGAREVTYIDRFIKGNLKFKLFDMNISIPYHSLVCLGITAVVITVLFILLYKSKWGLGVRATAANESTAGIIGINTYVITATSWAVAAGLAVLASVMLNAGGTQLTPTFMTQIQVNSFLSGILGGFSTFFGPVIGAIIVPGFTAIVGAISNIAFVYDLGDFADFVQKWTDVIVYVVLLIVVLIKPQGLFGKKIVKKV